MNLRNRNALRRFIENDFGLELRVDLADVRIEIDQRFTDLHSTTAFENPMPRPRVNSVQPGPAPDAKLLPFKRSLASVQVACGNPWCGFRWMARTCVVESTCQALDQCRRGKRALGRPAARRARTGIGCPCFSSEPGAARTAMRRRSCAPRSAHRSLRPRVTMWRPSHPRHLHHYCLWR